MPTLHSRDFAATGAAPFDGNMRTMTTYRLLLLPGDGIGPEVMAEAEKIAGFLTKAGRTKKAR